MKRKWEATAHRTVVQTTARVKRNSTLTNAHVLSVALVNTACAYVLLSRADMANVKVQTKERDSDVFVLNSTLVSGFFFFHFLSYFIFHLNLFPIGHLWVPF